PGSEGEGPVGRARPPAVPPHVPDPARGGTTPPDTPRAGAVRHGLLAARRGRRGHPGGHGPGTFPDQAAGPADVCGRQAPGLAALTGRERPSLGGLRRRFVGARASSGQLHCNSGTPVSAGRAPPSAMAPARSAAVNTGGRPLRGASFSPASQAPANRPVLYVAYLNRAGAGTICTTVTGGQECND